MASETELRDQLAVDRTLLANERTLLAYVRTALALGAGGAGLLQFGAGRASGILAWALIAAGALVLPIGMRRFVQVRRDLSRTRSDG
jgi:putative membrane protein